MPQRILEIVKYVCLFSVFFSQPFDILTCLAIIVVNVKA